MVTESITEGAFVWDYSAKGTLGIHGNRVFFSFFFGRTDRTMFCSFYSREQNLINRMNRKLFARNAQNMHFVEIIFGEGIRVRLTNPSRGRGSHVQMLRVQTFLCAAFRSIPPTVFRFENMPFSRKPYSPNSLISKPKQEYM